MAICGCGLPAHCCQPAVAGSVIYADLRSELSTYLLGQVTAKSTHLLGQVRTQSSPVRDPLLQAFPFPNTMGKVTLHSLSQACMFIYSSHGKWVFPPLLWSFPPSATLTSFLAPGSCAHAPAPALSGQAWLVYLEFQEGLPSPSLWHSGHPILFAMCLYCSYCLLLSFSLFPRWGSVCPGSYADLAQGCLWKYHIPLSSPCLRLPKLSGCRCLVAWGPCWFLCLM
jgi:hypothetical protein